MKTTNSEFLRGLLFLVLAQTMVGLNIVVSKSLVSLMSILFLLAMRFTFATLMLLGLHWLSPAKKISITQHLAQLNRKDWFYIVAQALTAGILFNFFMLFGLNYTDANVAGIITSALPAMIAIMSWLILSEKISAKKSLCVFFATAGLVIIACDKLKSIGGIHSFGGDLLVLLSLLPEATYYILCKLHSNRLPVFLVSAILNAINALILLMALLFIPWTAGELTLSNWLILSVLGLSSGLFYVFWFFGCQRVDGVLASLSTAVMPIATVIFAWVLLGEGLTLAEAMGMGLVVFSIVFYARK